MYCRLSRASDDSTSLQDQEAWGKDWCHQENIGINPNRVFSETISGFIRGSESQPELTKALELVRSDPGITHFLVRDLDRLSRRLSDITAIIDELHYHEITFVTQKAAIKPNSAEGLITVAVMGALAESEVQRTSDRLKRKAQVTRHAGGWNGVPPYGWKYKDRNSEGVKQLYLHPDESKVVRKIVDLYLKGKSVAEVVQSLIAEDIVNRHGKPFSYKAIQRILRHPILAGYQAISPETAQKQKLTTKKGVWVLVEDESGNPIRPHEPLVSDAEWSTISALAAPNPLTKRRRTIRKQLLTGLVYCKECGTKMTSTRAEEYTNYVCHGRASGRNCPGVGISAKSLDKYVLSITAHLCEQPEVKKAEREALEPLLDQRTQESLKAQQELKSDLENKRLDMQAHLKEAPSSAIGVLLERIRDIESRLEEVNDQINKDAMISPEIDISITKDDFLKMDAQHQRDVINSYIEKIEIKKDDGRKGAVKGVFGSQGINLARVDISLRCSKDARTGQGYISQISDQKHRCPDCDKEFGYITNLRHHRRFQHPKKVPCQVCSKEIPEPGLPSHMSTHKRTR